MPGPFRDSALITCAFCGEPAPREEADVTERGERCRRCSDFANVRQHGDTGPAVDQALRRWRAAPIPAPTQVTCFYCRHPTASADADIVPIGYRCKRCSLGAQVEQHVVSSSVADDGPTLESTAIDVAVGVVADVIVHALSGGGDD